MLRTKDYSRDAQMHMQVAVVEVPNTGDGSLRVRLQAS